jgi:hypothetical protein
MVYVSFLTDKSAVQISGRSGKLLLGLTSTVNLVSRTVGAHDRISVLSVVWRLFLRERGDLTTTGHAPTPGEDPPIKTFKQKDQQFPSRYAFSSCHNNWLSRGVSTFCEHILCSRYRAGSSLLQCIVSIPWVLIILCCVYVKWRMSYKGDGSRSTVSAYYSLKLKHRPRRISK